MGTMKGERPQDRTDLADEPTDLAAGVGAPPVGAPAWQTIAEVMVRLQLDLDRDWTLGEVARLAGYEVFHFAHTFRAVAGEPPLRYLRLLRLERAACDLSSDPSPSVLSVAVRAGYRSTEAFARAFRRATGFSPMEFQRRSEPALGPRPVPQGVPGGAPAGLLPDPKVGELGPLWGWTIRVAAFEPEEFGRALAELYQRCPPDGPWQLGGIAQPWGWVGGPVAKDLRAVRYVARDHPLPRPPVLPWCLPRSWYATFEYEGEPLGIAPACEWIVGRWVPRAGLRPAFSPTLSQIESFGGPNVRARLHAPVRVLRAVFG